MDLNTVLRINFAISLFITNLINIGFILLSHIEKVVR